jgi:hypothetical protein
MPNERQISSQENKLSVPVHQFHLGLICYERFRLLSPGIVLHVLLDGAIWRLKMDGAI